MADLVHRYVPRLRTVGRFTVPDDVQWDYVEAPAMPGFVRAEAPIPRSRYLHGVIATSRPLTVRECELYTLQPQRTTP